IGNTSVDARKWNEGSITELSERMELVQTGSRAFIPKSSQAVQERKIATVLPHQSKIDALKFDYSAFEEPSAIMPLGCFIPSYLGFISSFMGDRRTTSEEETCQTCGTRCTSVSSRDGSACGSSSGKQTCSLL